MAAKLPGLTHWEQKYVEDAIERSIGSLMQDFASPEAVRTGVAEWAGLLDPPQLIVRRADRRRR